MELLISQKSTFSIFLVLKGLMNNQECKIRPDIIDINANESLFYPYSILANKWSGSCNNINDAYAKLCVPDAVTNVRVFNLSQQIMKQDI